MEILQSITRKYHLSPITNRGYSSDSAVHDAAVRIKEKWMEGKECHVLHVGDHDPSGNDMTRDIRDRLATFGCKGG